MAQANPSYSTPFDFESHRVRIVIDADGPWFVGKDVCAALNLSNHNKALSRLNEDERKGVIISDPLGGNRQKAIGINEPGIYRLVFTSRVDAAERFKRWLAHEVLPAIRRDGSYTSGKPIHVREHDRRTSTKVEDALRLKRNIDRLESVVASIQPQAPNFCAMVIDGEHVFVDLNRFGGTGRAVVIDAADRLRIEYIENGSANRAYGARTAMGPWYEKDRGKARDALTVVGMVMEPAMKSAPVVDAVKNEITQLLEAGPFTDLQIAKRLVCAPALVKAVRQEHSGRIR